MASSTMPALELAFGCKMLLGPGGGTTRGCVATGSGMVSIGAPMPAAGNACGGCIDIPIIHGVGNGIGAISPNGAGGGINGGEKIGGGVMTGTSTAAWGECLGGTWVGPATGAWSAALVGVCLPCRPTVAAARGVQFLYSRVAAHLSFFIHKPSLQRLGSNAYMCHAHNHSSQCHGGLHKLLHHD